MASSEEGTIQEVSEEEPKVDEVAQEDTGASDETKTEESIQESTIQEIPEEGVKPDEGTKANGEPEPPVDNAEDSAAEPVTDVVNEVADEKEDVNELGGLDTVREDEEETEVVESSPIVLPENDAVPETEHGPSIEISEKLSRGGSPIKEEDESTFTEEDIPKATSTPPPEVDDALLSKKASSRELDSMGSDSIDQENSTPEFPLYDRAQLLEKYREALEERSQLQNLNNQLQHKLADYFRKKKTDDRAHELEKSVTDQEQRYLKYMSNLEDLHSDEKTLTETIKAQIEDLKMKCSEKQNKVQSASDEFSSFKYDIAKNAISNRSGKPLPAKDLEQIKSFETKKEAEVIQVRLENIKLKNRLKKREQQLKAKEELAEGLHLIDFEQLKIENQTYNEKIEERNEELLKLRKKITTTVQVLTHVKEKLQFVQGENEELRTGLYDVESSLAKKRDILTRTKQVRDALRNDNVRLKQKCGLLGNEPLLRDFEVRKDEGDDLRSKLEQLKEQHINLTMNLNGIKKKLEHARDQDS